MDTKKHLHIISHTHWDREWYQTFQGFRIRLVRMMDELIEFMEDSPEYKYFHMDGQTIILEDYLKIRPENEKRLKALIREGRIIIGPWYVMPDEFLISGESLIRNLLLGYSVCKSYGVSPMKNGYAVDVFGHNSQLPQILQGFGIDSATIYRGIGDYPKSEFIWEGADGNRVLALKLDEERSYSNFYFAIRWPFERRAYEKNEVKERMTKLLEFMEKRANTNHYLLMDGVDHIEIEPQIPQLMEMIREIQDVEIIHTSMEQYIDALKNTLPELEVIRGELNEPAYRGVNNQLLNGVLSSAVHIKQMNDQCERLLTCWVEPFSCFSAALGLNDYPSGLINEAWKYLLMNHPHDSICGCSITDVHKDNEYRFRQCRSICEELLEDRFNCILESIDMTRFKDSFVLTLFNSCQKEYGGVVTADIEIPAELGYGISPVKHANFSIVDMQGNQIPYQTLGVKEKVLKRQRSYRSIPAWKEFYIYSVAFEAVIPAMGYTCYGYKVINIIGPRFGDYTYKEFHETVRFPGTMRSSCNTWENGEIKISINHNGTVSITDLITGNKFDNLFFFEDGADTGDGWNYRKPVNDLLATSLSGDSKLSIEYDGRFFTRLRIVSTMNLPGFFKQDDLVRANDEKCMKIITNIDIRKGCRRIDFTTYLENTIKDHRLRVLFVSGIRSDTFFTNTPFDICKRAVNRPDYSNYIELDTRVVPNQGLLIIRDPHSTFCLFNKGLYEIEVMDDKERTIALTLLRSFKNEVGRNEGEMSYLQQSLKFEYAVFIGLGQETNSELLVEANLYRQGIMHRCDVPHAGRLPVHNSFISIGNSGAILSCSKMSRNGKLLILRLYNSEEYPISEKFVFDKQVNQVYRLDMKEDILEIIDSTSRCEITLGAKEVITLGIEFK